MKKVFMLVAAVALTIGAVSCGDEKEEEKEGTEESKPAEETTPVEEETTPVEEETTPTEEDMPMEGENCGGEEGAEGHKCGEGKCGGEE